MIKDRTIDIVAQKYAKEFECNKLFHDSIREITGGPGPMIDDEVCLNVICQLCKMVESLSKQHSEVRVLGNIW